jgi:hypothetical protein
MQTLDAIYTALCAPFALDQIELKPGATTRDKTRALAMAYADMRTYQERLDLVAGPGDWNSTYQMAAHGVICTLTICGVTKSGIGDYPTNDDDENPATSAEAQAFKRACSAFGIGRYLYDLPKIWCDYDQDKRQIVKPKEVAEQLYREARITTQQPAKPAHQATPAPKPTERASTNTAATTEAAAAPSTTPKDAEEAERRFWARYESVVGGREWQHVRDYLHKPALAKPRTIESWIAVAEQIKQKNGNGK